MEQLICTACGGNAFEPLAYGLYKCEFCGATLKEEKKEAPKKETHFVAPVDTGFVRDSRTAMDMIREEEEEAEEEKTRSTQIFVILLAVIALLGGALYLLFGGSGNKTASAKVINENVLRDSIEKASAVAMPEMPDLQAKPHYSEKGITVKNVELTSNYGNDPLLMRPGYELKLSLLKPKGISRKGNKVFLGISLKVKDHWGKETFSGDDINKTAGLAGEDFHKYVQQIEIPLTVGTAFGFEKGNYTIVYRVWDKLSGNAIEGEFPVFVSDPSL